MRAARNSLLILLLGLALGVLGKWSDAHVPLLADLTSGISFWIFLASAAALYSRTPRRAALHAPLLLGGMVCAYYLTAELAGGVWGKSFLTGWGLVAVLSFIPGYFVWFARGRSGRAWVLSLGVLAVQVLAVAVLFHGGNLLDALTIAATAVLLLRDKLGRKHVS